MDEQAPTVTSDHLVPAGWRKSFQCNSLDVAALKQSLLEGSHYIAEYRLAAISRAFDEVILERAMWSRETLELREKLWSSQSVIESLKAQLSKEESSKKRTQELELQSSQLQSTMQALDVAKRDLLDARSNVFETQTSLLDTEMELSELECAYEELKQSRIWCEAKLKKSQSQIKALEQELGSGNDIDLTKLKAKELQITASSAVEEAQEVRAENEKLLQYQRLLSQQTNKLHEYLHHALRVDPSICIDSQPVECGKHSCRGNSSHDGTPGSLCDEEDLDIFHISQMIENYLERCCDTIKYVQFSITQSPNYTTTELKGLMDRCCDELTSICPNSKKIE